MPPAKRKTSTRKPKIKTHQTTRKKATPKKEYAPVAKRKVV